MSEKNEIEFNGKVYSLVSRSRYYISKSSTNIGRKKAKSLHVDIWEFYNKTTVGKGFVIHHKDNNPLNNDIKNLERMSIRDHSRHHYKQRTNEQINKQKEHLNKIRHMTKGWHSSKEGIEWHRNNAKKCYERFKNVKNKFVCEFCEIEFLNRRKKKCCSRSCFNKLNLRKKRGSLFGIKSNRKPI